MSGLSYLSEYGSNSEDSDSNNENNNDNDHTRQKLPTPNLSKVPVVNVDTHEDDPQLHKGRLRSFSHVRDSDTDPISELITKLEKLVTSKVELCHQCDDFHISLSKTFILKYHLISPFSLSLQKTFNNVESFDLGFAAVKVYCNEEKSRTFISLEVEPFTQKYLVNISKKVDGVLTEFQLPTFYENPSFHMSILWVNGNKKSELDSILEDLNEILHQVIGKSLRSILVNTINCKSGNKYFQYSLH